MLLRRSGESGARENGMESRRTDSHSFRLIFKMHDKIDIQTAPIDITAPPCRSQYIRGEGPCISYQRVFSFYLPSPRCVRFLRLIAH